MTRLTEDDVRDLTERLEAFERDLVAACGLTLRRAGPANGRSRPGARSTDRRADDDRRRERRRAATQGAARPPRRPPRDARRPL